MALGHRRKCKRCLSYSDRMHAAKIASATAQIPPAKQPARPQAKHAGSRRPKTATTSRGGSMPLGHRSGVRAIRAIGERLDVPRVRYKTS